MAEIEGTMVKMMGAVMVAGVGLAVVQSLLAKEEEPAATGMSLQIISLTGPAVTAVAPLETSADVYEYETYLARVTITNLSTIAGQPAAATLKHQVAVIINDVSLLDSGLISTDYAAGESKTFDYQFAVPEGAAAGVGTDNASAQLYDPYNNLLASGALTLNVLENPIIIEIAEMWAHVRDVAGDWVEITGAEVIEWNIDVALHVRVWNRSRYYVQFRPKMTVTDPQGGTTILTLPQSYYAFYPGNPMAIIFDEWWATYLTTLYEGVYTLDMTIEARKSIDDPWVANVAKQWQFTVSAGIEYGGGIQVGV